MSKKDSSLIVNMSTATAMAKQIMLAGEVPLVHGSPGCGKTSAFRALAAEMNLKFVIAPLANYEPIDLTGFMVQKEGKGSYLPMDIFPIVGDELPIKTEATTDADGNKIAETYYDGWLVLCDELTSCDRDVQKAAYRLMLDRQVGHSDLHEKVYLAGAGNLSTDGAITEEMSSALKTRLVHIQATVEARDWLDNIAPVIGIDWRIQAFLRNAPQFINIMDMPGQEAEKAMEDFTYANGRTWEKLSNILKNIPNIEDKKVEKFLLPLLCGVVGQLAARQFYTFIKMGLNVPTIAQIIADPENTKVPTNAGEVWILSMAIASNLNLDNIGPLVHYASNKLPRDNQAVILRTVAKRDVSLIKATPEARKWTSALSADLFA